MKKIKTLTGEHKEKIRISNLGLKRTDETKHNISLAKKGKITWMKGKHHSEESKQKMRENCNGGIGTRFKVGHKVSKEISEKLSVKHRIWHKNNTHPIFFKGHKLINGGNSGHHHSEEYKERYKELRKNWTCPKYDTTIELKIQSFLKQLNIDFFTHQYIKDIEHGYQCDILIPVQEGITKKTIIECFGTYWHNYPLSKEVDIKRCSELREKGYRVLVFWENEIKVMELNVLKEVL